MIEGREPILSASTGLPEEGFPSSGSSFPSYQTGQGFVLPDGVVVSSDWYSDKLIIDIRSSVPGLVSSENNLHAQEDEEEGRVITFDELKEISWKKRISKIRDATRELLYLYRYFIGITLTFRDMEAYEEFQKDGGISRFRKALHQYYYRKTGKRDIADLWVLEVQKRGVPHFHILVGMGSWVKFPKPDEWLWPYGMSRIERLWRLSKGYLTKYLEKTKGHQVEFSRLRKLYKNLRTFGISYKAKTLWFELRHSFRRLLRDIWGISWKAKVKVQEGCLVICWYRWMDGDFVWLMRPEQFQGQLVSVLMQLWGRVGFFVRP